MLRRIAVILIAMASILGLTATPALAGNGTANYYLKGHCGIGWPLGQWLALDFTNYDNGANQTYHTSVTRSGVAIILDGIYVDGVYKGKSFEMFIADAGHGASTLTVKSHIVGSARAMSCSARV